jgi:hypothetical protein
MLGALPAIISPTRKIYVPRRVARVRKRNAAALEHHTVSTRVHRISNPRETQGGQLHLSPKLRAVNLYFATCVPLAETTN